MHKTSSVNQVKLCFVACTLAIAFPFIACRKSETSNPNSPTARIFKRNCAVCHGAQGEGKQLNAQIIPALNSGKAVAHTDKQLAHQITNGGSEMPPFGYMLKDKEISDLVRYIRDLQQNQ